MAGFGLGIGAGGGQRGVLPASQREMVREAVDLIVKAWTAPEPFDWNGVVWQGKGWHIIPQPLTKPHMEVGIACSRTDSTLELAAEKGFGPLLSWTGPVAQLRNMISTYLAATNPAARAPSRAAVRVARFIHVSDSVESAKRELAHADLIPVVSTGRLDGQIPAGGSRSDLTIDSLIDRGVFICGDPDHVHAQLTEFYREVGGFGTLLVVGGKDWSQEEAQLRSMRLFMNEVAPRLASLQPA
jgi:alkanesulfonate monooxygenase SsuD/methylene tetrahydromethanopterin reductase-like flavin-dependent oxidoreductase (luciferase family)